MEKKAAKNVSEWTHICLLHPIHLCFLIWPQCRGWWVYNKAMFPLAFSFIMVYFLCQYFNILYKLPSRIWKTNQMRNVRGNFVEVVQDINDTWRPIRKTMDNPTIQILLWKLISPGHSCDDPHYWQVWLLLHEN